MSEATVRERLWSRRAGMITRDVAGETLLVPVAQKIDPEAALYTLDSVAAFVWEKLKSPQSAQSLAAALVDEFDVAPEQAAADVGAFLEKLSAIGAALPEGE